MGGNWYRLCQCCPQSNVAQLQWCPGGHGCPENPPPPELPWPFHCCCAYGTDLASWCQLKNVSTAGPYEFLDICSMTWNQYYGVPGESFENLGPWMGEDCTRYRWVIYDPDDPCDYAHDVAHCCEGKYQELNFGLYGYYSAPAFSLCTGQRQIWWKGLAEVGWETQWLLPNPGPDDVYVCTVCELASCRNNDWPDSGVWRAIGQCSAELMQGCNYEDWIYVGYNQISRWYKTFPGKPDCGAFKGGWTELTYGGGDTWLFVRRKVDGELTGEFVQCHSALPMRDPRNQGTKFFKFFDTEPP